MGKENSSYLLTSTRTRLYLGREMHETIVSSNRCCLRQAGLTLVLTNGAQIFEEIHGGRPLALADLI